MLHETALYLGRKLLRFEHDRDELTQYEEEKNVRNASNHISVSGFSTEAAPLTPRNAGMSADVLLIR